MHEDGKGRDQDGEEAEEGGEDDAEIVEGDADGEWILHDCHTGSISIQFF